MSEQTPTAPVVSVRQARTDIWALHARGAYLVDPTNAFVKRSGENVMGAGISRQAALRWPELPRGYGIALLARVRPSIGPGATVTPADLARPHLVVDDERRLCLAIVKHNFWEPAQVSLVATALEELGDFLAAHPDADLALPELGCGNGKLDWERDVKPLVRAWLGRLPEEARRRVIVVLPPTQLSTGVTKRA